MQECYASRPTSSGAARYVFPGRRKRLRRLVELGVDTRSPERLAILGDVQRLHEMCEQLQMLLLGPNRDHQHEHQIHGAMLRGIEVDGLRKLQERRDTCAAGIETAMG